jgi:hypothetical protein
MIKVLSENINSRIEKNSFKTLKQKYNWESQEKVLIEAYNEL